jgi:hypothetical protein
MDLTMGVNVIPFPAGYSTALMLMRSTEPDLFFNYLNLPGKMSLPCFSYKTHKDSGTRFILFFYVLLEK